MDLQKIGRFLKVLRKEQALTQEQLAEKLNVSRRTVSRWETGSNMPDLDLLLSMADLYRVDLRDLLKGERKGEHMDEALKETVLQVADYSNEEKARLLQRMHWMFIIGLIGFATFVVTELGGLDKTALFGAIGGFGLGIAWGTLMLGVVFTSRYALKIRAFKLRILRKMQGKAE